MGRGSGDSSVPVVKQKQQKRQTLINHQYIVYISQTLISILAPYDPLPAILWNCCQVSGP